MTYNPALEAPLTEIPHTLVGIMATGKVYYFEFDSEPGPDEYVSAGAAIVRKAYAQPVQWVYCPSAELRWNELHSILQSGPVRVR